MNKKGFTLVELLAVIAILALLVIIALPNVLSMFNEAKKDIFLIEAKTIYKEVSKNIYLKIRIANKSIPSECSNGNFSQFACGFVLEFENSIVKKSMTDTNQDKVDGQHLE
ncbi:MAG: type II secretion system GspH family protein [Tenericutes bacterium]|nr:type II secretion system GspH family protein [Mycoplasmatota bacterium]